MSPAATPRQAAAGPPEARIVLRTSSEAVEAGYAMVMGFDATAIHEEMLRHAGAGWPSREHPCGTGDAMRKILVLLRRTLRSNITCMNLLSIFGLYLKGYQYILTTRFKLTFTSLFIYFLNDT